MNRLLWIMLLGSLTVTISGCFLAAPPAPEDSSPFQLIQVDDLQAEINRRENLVDPDNENHLALGVLYTHPRNQKPDYPAAEKHLNEYLAHLPPEKGQWPARYIYHLLKRINAGDESVRQIQNQCNRERNERLSLAMQGKADKKKLEVIRAALQKSKKRSKRLQVKLKRTEAKLTAVSRLYKRQQIENDEFKKKLNDLTELYLDLEKKRQQMQ